MSNVMFEKPEYKPGFETVKGKKSKQLKMFEAKLQETKVLARELETRIAKGNAEIGDEKRLKRAKEVIFNLEQITNGLKRYISNDNIR